MDRLIIQLGRSKIILTFIAVIGLIVGYMGYSDSEQSIVGLTGSSTIKEDDLESFTNLVLDFSVLDDERYKALEIFGENPVDPGITGERKNPFDPL